jgi:hypothetical protein
MIQKDGLKMNKANMQRLIDAIRFDGQKKFNMNLFIGKLENDYLVKEVFELGQLASKYKPTRVSYIEEGTSMFNCTSMGCIAGFATALANDWKAPSWLAEDNASMHVSQFEQAANEFLGFTHEEGRNLYFADCRSIWKWLQYVEPMRYSELGVEEYNSIDDAYDEGDMQWDDDDLYADFNTIDYLTAIDVLTRIMNEEIGLADLADNEPYYIREEAVIA